MRWTQPQPGRPTFLNVSRERLDDLCNARVIVEVACTEIAIAKLTPRAFQNLEHLANGHVTAGRTKNTSDMLSKNQEFHFAVYEAAGSAVLLQLVNTLWLRFGPYLRLLNNHMEAQLETGAIEIYTIHHQHLIAAMKAQDASSAKRHMELDIRSTQHLLQPICDAHDGLSEVA